MRSFFGAFLGFFLTPGGLMVLAALDSSLVFFMPLGMDVALILMSARQPDLVWLFTILATAGSMVGSAVTFWVGRQIGQHGLSRFIKPSRLTRIEQRVSHRAAVSVAALALVPPPFPFTAFVLASGAFALNTTTFFLTLATAKLVRFGVMGGLAARFGSGIVRWMETPTFEVIVGGFIVLAIGGTAVSAIALIKSTRRPKEPQPEPGS